MSLPIRLIAIGGGGFTHQTDPAMEDFILAQSGRVRPRIGFIGAASQDDPAKIDRFHARFAQLSDHLTHLPQDSSAEEAARWAQALDIIYVGGGNTLRLIAHWQQSGWDRVLHAAAQRGVLMAGVSAGASVWFEQALSDAGGEGLRAVPCTGMVTGSCCPHYSTEPARPPAFAAAIASGALKDGLAIDDGVAVLIEGNKVLSMFSSRPEARAYRLSRQGDQVASEALRVTHPA
jgi:dipeptidase E